ncbi:MAG: TRAP transporter small permease [Chromatiales bacterium]|jgi:TRAP-type C4-dicarboxylate transport system permease small subunit
MLSLLKNLRNLLIRLEEGLLVLILSAMILLATWQILMRNLFDSGLFWADPALRMMVLWLALLGAIAATRDDRHIRIDILSSFLGVRVKAWVHAFNDLFSSLICGLIAWHGGRLVYFEWQDGTQLFGSLPTWLGESIIPLGFGIMALRFLFSAPLRLKSGVTPC